MLEGKIQIYLPDMKYSDNEAAKIYSGAPDYFETAQKAIDEMFRQVGRYRMNEDGTLMERGLIVRHLILPSHLRNTYGVIDWFARRFSPGDAMLSLMSQYIPSGHASQFPKINRTITAREYHKAQEYLFASGIEDGFLQSRKAASDRFVPVFDLEGVLPSE